jgi:WhiB family redox-sensing transcriptional regulator
MEPRSELEWQERALCRYLDEPGLFFPPDRGLLVKEAKHVCAACVVREQCLAFALENDEQFGVWGGYLLSNRQDRLEAG